MARRAESPQWLVLTVGDVIRDLLPQGNNPREPDERPRPSSWDLVPLWAPDLFAVVASLAERSGFYAEPGIALSTTPKGRLAKRQRAAEAEQLGADWGRRGIPPEAVNLLWRDLWRDRAEHVGGGTGAGSAWKLAAMRLLAIADEACAGIGFPPIPGADKAAPLGNAIFVFEEYRSVAPRSAKFLSEANYLPYLPNSLTRAVPADRVCVLPKALTPAVGCTLRSMTHNLALLPGKGEVTAEWRLVDRRGEAPLSPADGRPVQPFNLLLVPYPYTIEARDIAQRRPPDDVDVDGYFELNQGWLPEGTAARQARQLTDFLLAMVDAAEREGGSVHGIVLPETALPEAIAAKLGAAVARQRRSIEVFIAGTIAAPPKVPRALEPPFPRNEVFVARFAHGQKLDDYRQAKHHRWRIDSAQVRNYQLGHVLDAERSWWEAIDLADRRIVFGLDGREAVIAALICEDLARYDPVQPVLSAVGPNLVIALLMDGPQLARRWPGRYATVLAEDPGSAVLTLTSAGMVRRSQPPAGVAARDCVALWTERDRAPQEIDLAPGAHGLLLALSAHPRRQKTLDLRRQRDSGGLVEYRLGGIRHVRLADPNRFEWLDR